MSLVGAEAGCVVVTLCVIGRGRGRVCCGDPVCHWYGAEAGCVVVTPCVVGRGRGGVCCGDPVCRW